MAIAWTTHLFANKVENPASSGTYVPAFSGDVAVAVVEAGSSHKQYKRRRRDRRSRRR